jgi:hypothetical protein
MFLKRVYKSLIGFVTCTAVVLLLMYLIWPTIVQAELISLDTEMRNSYGGGGHFWVILLMLLVVNIFLPITLPIPLPYDLGEFELTNQFGDWRLYLLIVFIWLVGAFAGGLASRGGLRSGAWSAMLSFLFLDLIFAAITPGFNIPFLELGGTGTFFVTFLFTLIVGSFILIPIIGLVGGAIGGILGKMLFRKKKSKDEVEEED